MAEYPFVYRHVTDQMGTVRPTRYRERNENSPNYNWDDEGSSSDRTYYVPWGTDPNVMNVARQDFLGYSVTSANRKYISRYIPHAHPDFPLELYAKSVSAQGTIPRGKDDEGVGTFTEACMRVGYQAPPYQILTDDILGQLLDGAPDESSLLRYCSFEMQTSAKFQTIPSTSPLKWAPRAGWPADNGPPPGQPVVNVRTVLLHEGDLQITWHQVPLDAIPVTAMSVCINRTNLYAFGNPESIAGTYPPMTLVCGVPRRKIIRMPNGLFAADITYVFKYYPQGANYFFFMEEGKAAGYYPTSFDPAGTQLLYRAVDFNDLFRPEL